MKEILFLIFGLIVGFVIGEMQAHIKETMWGLVWTLEPKPDFPGLPFKAISQLVKCPNGDLTFGSWHVLVLYDSQAPFKSFLQERGY